MRYYTYIIHIDPPIGRVRHYTGSTTAHTLKRRMREHATGRGSALLRAAVKRRCTLTLAYLEEADDRSPERRLKRTGRAVDRCSVCNAHMPARHEYGEIASHPEHLQEPRWTSFGS